jgi:drug/metabolite transporter (DMT)-like permease
MGIMYGLVAAFCWGLGDFLITHLTRRVGTPRAMVYAQALSLLAWTGLLIAQPHAPVSMAAIWALAAMTGICHVLGLLLTYRAFEIGTLSLVSPIASGFAVVTALLALVSGEHPPVMALGGAALLCTGIVLATRSPGGATGARNSLSGVPEAIGSALAFGTMFWMFYFFVQPQLGYVWPLIILKFMSSGSALIGLVSSRARSAPSQSDAVAQPAALEQPASALHTVLLLALGVAATDTLAWIAYIRGTGTEYATIVTALASLFSVVTVLLAWAFLRERLALNQWVGVAIILLGVFLVSL